MARRSGFNVVALVLAAAVGAAASPQVQDEPGGVYVIAYRTPAHVRTSSGEVFHNAAADTRRLLSDYGVTVVVDPERDFIENESRMSVASMTQLARDAGATSLLFVTVDRPITQWIRITLQAYDLDGSLLWEEKADSGMGSMTGGAGYRKCVEKLEKIVAVRAGGRGLPAGSPADPKGEF